MSKKHTYSFFDHIDHPDESTLWLYSQGELTRKDMHRVEQHLIDCPMCSDVVDGFSMYESESSLNASKNRAYLMFERALKKRKKRKVLYLAMAAVFVMVAISAVVLINDFTLTTTQKNSSVAHYTPLQQDVKSSGDDGIIIEQDTVIGGLAKNEQKNKKTTVKPKTGETTATLEKSSFEPEEEMEETEKLIDEEDGLDTKSEQVVIDEMAVLSASQDKSKQRDTDTFSGMVEDSGQERNDFADLTKMETKEETVYVADRANANLASDVKISNDKTVVHEDASVKSDVSVRKEQDSHETVANNASVEAFQMAEPEDIEKKPLYQQGVDAKKAGKLSEAIRLFLRVPEGDSSYWNAQWQIANIHRTRGDTVEAVKVYSILKDTSNPHQHSARFFYDLLAPDEDQ